MAKLSTDGTYVTVESGDTLWDIARTHLGSGNNYTTLAAINNIPNPNLIFVGQKIKLINGGSSSSSNTSSNSNKPTITMFGVRSDEPTQLFAVWSWNKSHTASYKILWAYETGDGVWFVGNNSSITVDKEDFSAVSRQSLYSIPSGAKKVKFNVKPISETYKKNDKETTYWEAEWSDTKTYSYTPPMGVPSTPSVEIDTYKLTASLDNIDIEGATGIEFEIVKNNAAKVYKTGKSKIVTGYASYSCTVDAGGEYKVRCRSYKSGDESEWSDYSSNMTTIPAAPSGITTLRASSSTAIYIEWSVEKTATTYDIEYTTKKEYFDGSDQTTTKSGIESTHYEIIGLESGSEYFFRVRATNSEGSSAWSGIKSVVIGKDPAAPTTWSSTTTAIAGEPVNLYWVHNTEDGSSQVYAELELTINGAVISPAYTITNLTSEEEKDKTSSATIDTTNGTISWREDSGIVTHNINSTISDGVEISWRVRTAGITRVYGDWSIQRTIDIYAPPTLQVNVVDNDGDELSTITMFPFYISAIAGPANQPPIGYHLVIASNEVYETADSIGNSITVNAGDRVYSKYFDITEPLMVELSANNIDLKNNIQYTVNCTVSLSSGLRAEATTTFRVSWAELKYEPNAEISIDEESLTVYIRPYCDDRKIVIRKVVYGNGVYTATDDAINGVYGSIVPGEILETGEPVYSGVDADGHNIYYCYKEDITPVPNVYLSVYRREFDGSFTEIASGLDGIKSTTVTDPHPSLDYARYRIVASDKNTGSISFYDLPGYPVGGTAAVIQWDEEWTSFDATEEDGLQQPPWSGSLLKLMYNIDVSDSNTPDVTLVEYAGREHPIGYYGTQLGHSATWNMEIDKSDKETVYALRRLQRWMGDVYVREPSGSGYWANITVSFSQKHREMVIPVTLNIKRVEGGA